MRDVVGDTHVHVCARVCLFVYLVYMSVLQVCLSVCLFVYLSVCVDSSQDGVSSDP